MQQVVGAADARCNLLTPAEIDVRKTDGIEGGIMFVIEPQAGIYRQAARTDRPGILQIERLVGGICEARIGNVFAAGKEITVLPLAQPARVRGLDGGTSRGACFWSVIDAPNQIDDGSVRGHENIVPLT